MRPTDLMFAVRGLGPEALAELVRHAEVLHSGGSLATDDVSASFRLYWSRMSADERRVHEELAARVDRGRPGYGPLAMATDGRDLRAEGTAELLDFIWYETVDRMKKAGG